MQFTIVTCLLATASHVLAQAIAEPELVAENHLENRQGAAVANPAVAATPAAVQYPSITTQWLESTILSTTTWIEVIYTQQFSAVPDQLPSAIPGEIGYGTLTKNGKREVEARETGIAGSDEDYILPIVIEVREEIVTQWVRPVKEVLVLHTVMVYENDTLFGHSTLSNATSVNMTSGNSAAGSMVFRNVTLENGNSTSNATDTTEESITSTISSFPWSSGYATGLNLYSYFF